MRRLRYADVGATIALALPLAGTGYAATRLPAGAAPGAVDSSRVADRCLRAIDFAKHQLPTGPAGPAGLTGAESKPGPAGPPGAPASKLFAHVAADGALSTIAKGAVSAARTETGAYAVHFAQDLGGCIATAQLGFVAGEHDGSADANVSAFTQIPTHASTRTLVFIADNASGTPTDAPFNLAVLC